LLSFTNICSSPCSVISSRSIISSAFSEDIISNVICQPSSDRWETNETGIILASGLSTNCIAPIVIISIPIVRVGLSMTWLREKMYSQSVEQSSVRWTTYISVRMHIGTC
jgi:hypothetical protein